MDHLPLKALDKMDHFSKYTLKWTFHQKKLTKHWIKWPFFKYTFKSSG